MLRKEMCLFGTALGWGCVSMVLVGMGLRPLTAFSERLDWPPGSPGITPMPEGTQRASYIWIAAEHGVEHTVSLSPLLPVNRVQPTHRRGCLKQVHRQRPQKRSYYEQKEFELSWRKDFIIQANLRTSLDEPLLNNLIKVLGEVANCKLMRTADGTKLGSVLRAVDDRSNTGDWERLELGIEIKKMRFLHEKQQADTSGRKYCAK